MATKTKDKIIVAGMGAVIHDKGIHFRVWAPHANQVFVSGEFNDWSDSQNKMLNENNGYWALNIPKAKTGQQYKYVLETNEGKLFRNDPYAKEVTNSAGNSIITDPSFSWGDDGFQMPAWNRLVIYEIHIGTFNRKEPAKPGSFDSAIEKLPYLQQLGINAVEIMPPAEFIGGISWGYNPSHPFATESDYGGMTEFKKFVNAAHQHGIAVILDVVYNHFGPDDLDLWRFDGWSENDGGGIYFYQDWRRKTPWGDTRPDYGRSEVRQYIRDNALMWLEEYHVDGLRADAISYIRNANGSTDPKEDLPDGWSLMQWINKEIQERFPWKITIAEDMLNNEWITKPKEVGGEGFSTQWDIGFVEPVRKLLIATRDEDRSMKELSEAILKLYNGDAFQRVIFTESHDEVGNQKSRVPEEIAPANSDNWFAKKRSVLGAVLTFTSPGIPMIFQGQEMLEGGYFKDTEPLNWDRMEQFKGITHLYKDLIYLRLDKNGISKGLTGQHTKLLYKDDEQKIIAYHRYDEGGAKDSVVVVLNFADKDHRDLVIPFPEEGLWKVRFNSDWKGYDASFGDEFAYDTETFDTNHDDNSIQARVNIGPYNAIILSKD
jgi:1,4-alpha-glucan branching enzyme